MTPQRKAWMQALEEFARAAATLAAAGFEVYNSGGHCMVWNRDAGDEVQYTIVAGDDHDLIGDPDAPIWACQWQDWETGFQYRSGLRLADAIDLCKRLPITATWWDWETPWVTEAIGYVSFEGWTDEEARDFIACGYIEVGGGAAPRFCICAI